MRFICKLFLQILTIVIFATSAHCASWEETDGKYFANGNLATVKQILSKEEYSGELLIDAFQFAAMSGNVELVKYLEQRGWGKICRKHNKCDPVNFAVLSRKQPKMVAYLLARGFPPTGSALYSASAQVIPDEKQFSGGLQSVKLLCESGANPEEKQQLRKSSGSQIGPAVLEKLEERINSSHMDLGRPLSDARGIAAEVLIATFFKKSACKKGAATSTDFDNILAIVQSIKRGVMGDEIQAMLDAAHFSPQVETYLLYEAIASENLKLLEHLGSQGWLKRCRSDSFCRPFDVAAEAGVPMKVFQFLATEGFEVDSHNVSGGTPLMYATLNAKVDAVKFLCEHGADYRKRVKLEIDDRSIVSILRRSYSSAWDRAEGLGQAEGEGLVGPQTSVSRPECMPGAACMSTPFPPKGNEQVVSELKSLAEIFQHFRGGHCQPAICTSDVATKAVVIENNVNLHAGPSMNSKKIEVLPFGTVLEVLDSSRSCESYSTKKGRWISAKVHANPQYQNQSQSKSVGWVFDAYVDYFLGFEP